MQRFSSFSRILMAAAILVEDNTLKGTELCFRANISFCYSKSIRPPHIMWWWIIHFPCKPFIAPFSSLNWMIEPWLRKLRVSGGKIGKTNPLKEQNVEFKATGIEATHPRAQQNMLSISGYCFNSSYSQQSTAMFTGQVWGHNLYLRGGWSLTLSKILNFLTIQCNTGTDFHVK